MKKFFKWALIVFLGIVVLVGGYAGYVAVSDFPTYEVKSVTLTVERTPERIAHGRVLATSLCMLCHMNPETKVLSGARMLDMPPEFGVVYSKNITQHPEKGIGKWTDGELAWFLRTGINPRTGRQVPYMPVFPHMADEDLMSIIAWLRSDDAMLAASPADNRESQPTFLAKLLGRLVFSPFEYPTKSINRPDTLNTVQYGKYLATGLYDCYGCHLADFADMNQHEPEKSAGFLGGGMAMPDAVGHMNISANITPDKQTGIGSWTRDEFIKVLSTGIRRDGTPLRYPMIRMNKISEYALGCIYDYLKTAPPISKKIERTPPKGPWASDGERLFDVWACTSCHGKDGLGYASLKLAHQRYPDDSVLIDVIKDQPRYNPDGFMPKYADVIPEADLKVLAAHVRKLCN